MSVPIKAYIVFIRLIMNSDGPVIIIEDDIDDKDILEEVFQKLKYPNQLLFFADGQEALEFLNSSEVTPFIILSDINMPKLDGFALRDKIKMDAKLQMKCIPYLFFSTASSQKAVVDAYSLSVQGFFVKQNSMAELEKTITVIMEYWKRCVAPKHFSHFQ
jgi:CheY-like chemotaxis protein